MATIKSVKILPVNPTINVGGMVDFQVIVTLNDGTIEHDFTPVWKTDNGTISKDGQYNPATVGEHMVSVNVAGVEDSTIVIIGESEQPISIRASSVKKV